MGEILLSHVRSAFERERVICRVIAAWLGFSALALLGADAESFSEIAFGQDVSLTKIALGTAIAFLLFSLVSVAAGEWVNTDSWFLLLCGGICSVRWLLLYEHSSNEFLFALCICAVLALILVYFFRVNERLFSYWTPGRGTIVAVAVAALVALTVVVSAAAAAVVAALVMVVADGVGVKVQVAGDQGLDSHISHTDDTGIDHDTGLSQSSACAAADTAADQHIHLHLTQKISQSTVTAAAGGNHHGVQDLTCLNIIDLELLGVTEMLKNLLIFISNRDSHVKFLHIMVLLCRSHGCIGRIPPRRSGRSSHDCVHRCGPLPRRSAAVFR